MDKKKKIIAIVVPIVLVLLIALIIVLIVVLPKNNQDKCAEGHSYVYADLGENHKKSCSNCSFEEEEAHTYDDNSDTTCNDCGHTRTVHTHSYVYTKLDDTSHTKTCSCNEINVTEDHVFENEEDKTCDLCGYERTVGYPYTTPSGVKISASKTDLTAGDTFTLSVVIEANMPDCVWHSVSLLMTALDSNNRVDATTASYFEYVSHTTNLDSNYFQDTTSGHFDNSNPLNCGLKVSINNRFNAPQQTLATQKLELTVTLKVKDDAPTVGPFNFGVSPIKANFVRYKNTTTGQTVNHQANNKTFINNVEDTEAGDCLTLNKLELSITAKSN